MTELSRDDIVRLIRTRLPELRATYGVRSLGLFGSYSRHEPKPNSDVDVDCHADAHTHGDSHAY